MRKPTPPRATRRGADEIAREAHAEREMEEMFREYGIEVDPDAPPLDLETAIAEAQRESRRFYKKFRKREKARERIARGNRAAADAVRHAEPVDEAPPVIEPPEKPKRLQKRVVGGLHGYLDLQTHRYYDPRLVDD